MNPVVGVRREDKSQWERRVPLVPLDVEKLKRESAIKLCVQPSEIRVFQDEAYKKAGATVSESLADARVILAVKEIPPAFFEAGKTYVFFSHTTKGQAYNMPMLKRMMALKCNLIDYEKILDDQQRRLIFFGRYAGLAGMVESLSAFGKKMELQGFNTPLKKVKPAFEYGSLEEAKAQIAAVGDEIGDVGFDPELAPVVIGFAGYGNVSRGAQEIFDLLPHKVVSPAILLEMAENFSGDPYNLYKVIFKEEDLVRPLDGPFDLLDYYQNPRKYRSCFEDYLPLLNVLVNCIYWTEKYPRLVTREYLYNSSMLRSISNLRVIGDISCDIGGSIEITHKATQPDLPCFTYFPRDDTFKDGVHRTGITVMAVDNLPCEFPRDASSDFSAVLSKFIPAMVAADFSKAFADLSLPDSLKNALILHNGELTEKYRYMETFLGRGTE